MDAVALVIGQFLSLSARREREVQDEDDHVDYDDSDNATDDDTSEMDPK